MPHVPLVPLAVEYVFWDERLPEALLHFGDPVHIVPDMPTVKTTRELEDALGAAMYALQQAAVGRDVAAFETLFTGARGTGGAYGTIRRARALLGGQRPVLDHTPRDAPEGDV